MLIETAAAVCSLLQGAETKTRRFPGQLSEDETENVSGFGSVCVNVCVPGYWFFSG